MRIDQPSAAMGERVGKVAVLGDHPAKTREIGESGIGRERQHDQDRSDGDVVEYALADDGRDKLREDALIAGLARLGGADAIHVAEVCDAGQQKRQQGDDRGECAAGVDDRRVAERADAVADRLDARHRRAAAGERPHQDPEGRAAGYRRQCRRMDHRLRMAARCDRLHQTDGDDSQQRHDECVCRCHEGDARLLHPAQVDDRDEGQRRQAERQDVGLEDRHGRHERPDPRGDADRDHEDVIQHQGRRGEQARPRTEVLLGDRIRTASVRVRRDRLSVREVDDREQRDDQRGNRPDVPDTANPQGDQQRECGLGPVRRRCQGIESQHRDAGQHADALVFLFQSRQPAAEQPVQYCHTFSLEFGRSIILATAGPCIHDLSPEEGSVSGRILRGWHILHTNPTRQRGECLRTLAGASG